MTTINVPTTARAPIQVNRWARNGQYPDVTLQSQMTELCNQVAAYRPKEVFRYVGGIAPVVTSNGDRARWRFAFHTGPFTTKVYCRFLMLQADKSGDPYAQMTITDSAGATTGTAIFHYGANGTSATDVPANFGVGADYVTVLPDTDYCGLISDFTQGRILSACVYEVPLDPSTDAGYLDGTFAVGAPILAKHRADLLNMARNLWRRSGSQVLNWSVDVTALVATATATNVIDTTSTTVSTATPGFTIDMTGKARVSQTTGVPCVIKAYGVRTGGIGDDTVVQLVNSAGTLVASLTGFPNGSADWVSLAFNMPLGIDKYDLQFYRKNGTPFSLTSVSIYEYEA